MLLLGLDFETTGLDASTDRVIEIGAVLWDTEDRTPVKFFSEMVRIDTELPEEITKITGIKPTHLARFGLDFRNAWEQFLKIYDYADFVCAHNAPFDKSFFDAECARFGCMPRQLLWIDTNCDVEYPDHIKHKNLTYLSATHNFLNPFAHRAVFDVLTMLKVLDNYPFEDVLALAREPNVKLRAVVSFDQKDLAKGAGFYWDGKDKIWFKVLKQSKAEQELLLQREFKVVNLGVAK